MTLQFEIIPASKCPKKDVIEALELYSRTVDVGSFTDTNQIKDYIWNPSEHKYEKRTMFFHLFYGNDGSVEGFSEIAYLPENQALMIDYICTKQRNHVLFYNFYHMIIQDITDTLKQDEKFVRYIITELSLNQIDGRLIDPDSNYFRHLLSNEGFKLLKYPYYQPSLLPHEKVTEFNLAIKLTSIDSNSAFLLEQGKYLSIVREIYNSHYLAWYESFHGTNHTTSAIKELISRVQKEILQSDEYEPISLVQCELFEDGQCPQYSAENITIPRARKRKWKLFGVIIAWIALSVVTFILCLLPIFSKVAAIVCSFFTIIAGTISIVSFRDHIFHAK